MLSRVGVASNVPRTTNLTSGRRHVYLEVLFARRIFDRRRVPPRVGRGHHVIHMTWQVVVCGVCGTCPGTLGGCYIPWYIVLTVHVCTIPSTFVKEYEGNTMSVLMASSPEIRSPSPPPPPPGTTACRRAASMKLMLCWERRSE